MSARVVERMHKLKARSRAKYYLVGIFVLSLGVTPVARAADALIAPDVEPALRALVDDPRYAELETRMLASVNADRELLGLGPFDENYQVQQ